MSPPELSTGWAAPMFVAGAMPATAPAIVMNVPADAARTAGAEHDQHRRERELEGDAAGRGRGEACREPGRGEWRLPHALGVDRAREGGAERVLIAFVHGRSAPRRSCRAACAARSFP